MIHRYWPALALTLAHAACAVVPSTLQAFGPVPQTEKLQTWRAAAAQTLAARGDAESLAAAAALSFIAPPARSSGDPASLKAAAVELAARASELDPENPCIGWLRLVLCANTSGCDMRDAATTMRWVDADNGAVWIPTLAAAQKERDAMEVDRVLADMSQGVRFDLYWNRTVVLLFDALRKARAALPAKYLPSDVDRLSEAQVIAGTEVIPPLAPVLTACREPNAAERREACLRLSKVMQRGDTVIAQMAGLTLERRLSQPDSREARSVAEHRHLLEWRVATASQVDAPLLPWLKEARARGRIAEMRALPREEDVDIAILRHHKMPIEPQEAHP